MIRAFRTLIIVAIAALTLSPMLHAQIALAADFARNGQAPQITQKGVTYTTGVLRFPYGQQPSSQSQISFIAWTVDLETGTTPDGMVTQLCGIDNTVSPATATCLNISALPKGSTTMWNGLFASTTQFYLTFRVPGTGRVSVIPYFNNDSQVMMNYINPS